ncbi:MAG: XRE family transcriptional regulator [Bacteroidota bacterium]
MPTSDSQPIPNGEDAFLERIYSVLSDGEVEDLPALLARREEELGITETQAWKILGFSSANQLRRLKNGETKKIDALTLVKLSNYLNLGVDGLARVIVSNMTPSEIAEIEKTRARHFVAKHFYVKGLKEIGFISDHNDLDAVAERITWFFRLRSVFDYNAQLAAPLFMQRRMSFRDEMRAFWVEAVRYQFERHPNPFPFDREQLMGLLPQIRQYSQHESTGLLTVARALFRAGITVIAQPYAAGTAVHGATFVVDGRPCIVLTDLGKKYPALWFSLLHELAHVLYDWDQLTRVVFHLSGEADTMLVEDRANYVARELLLPEEKLNYIANHLDNPHLVKSYAAENDIHPSLIYWLYARREYERTGDGKWFAIYSKHIKVDPSRAIRAISCYPWDKEDVDSDMENVIRQLASA